MEAGGCFIDKDLLDRIMKKVVIAGLMALFMALGVYGSAEAQYYGGPGIVMAGSQQYSSLPEAARQFIEKHFKGEKATKCEQYFAKRKYEVELSNGVDLEFDNQGRLTEIDAPDGKWLSPHVVKGVLHSRSYHRLEKAGLADKVESIEFDKKGLQVEVELDTPGPDTYIFDINGNFIDISD